MNSDDEIKKAVDYLAQGKVILYPTDTIWGIGCDATNIKAVEKVYAIKKRFDKKSLIVLLDDVSSVANFVTDVPPIAYKLMESITTPLTIVYPRAKNLAANVVADDGTIAIRVTRNEFCRRMVHGLGKPVVSTSANITGVPAPVVFSQISEEIRREVDYAVNLNRDVIGSVKASTIIRVGDKDEFEVLRK